MSLKTIMLGLTENDGQFWLPVLVNRFVGAMVGLERPVIPQFVETAFWLNGHTTLLNLSSRPYEPVNRQQENLIYFFRHDLFGRDNCLL